MEEYQNFSVADFALEESFIQWVIKNDPESRKFWKDWLERNPEKKEDIEMARRIVLAMKFQEEEISQNEINEEWNKQYTRLTSYLRYKTWNSHRTPFLSFQYFGRIAAALLIIATSIFVLRWLTDKPALIEEKPVAVVKETPKGQKLTIVLPDGSEIKLNSDSRIEYPSKFIGDTREVNLEGEAYFDVTHDTKRPFIVNTGDIATVVLGTSFNINAFPENEDVKIALVTGQVKVNMKDHFYPTMEAFLKPNEMISINKRESKHQIIPFNAEEITGWKDGSLYFKKAGFEEIRIKLERWYGVNFEINPKTRIDQDLRFNGKFQNKSLAYILDVFSYPDLFKYKIEDRKVIIY